MHTAIFGCILFTHVSFPGIGTVLSLADAFCILFNALTSALHTRHSIRQRAWSVHAGLAVLFVEPQQTF